MFPAIFWITIAIACPIFASGAVFHVTNGADSGPGTFRQALIDANSLSGPDAIHFNVPVNSLTNRPISALPVITDTLTIDGTTQAEYSDAPIVTLQGDQLDSPVLHVAATGCTIRGLVIISGRRNGIELDGGGGHVIEHCHIGLANSGLTRAGNLGHGILVTNSANNTIGSSVPGFGNIISANRLNGVAVGGAFAIGNAILGNSIGFDRNRLDAGNSRAGIHIGSAQNVVGSASSGGGNQIAGNSGGVVLSGTNATDNVIVGNYFGTDSLLQRSFPSGLDGILISSAGRNRIGGTNVAEGNMILNHVNGIRLTGRTATNNIIQGNRIGPDHTMRAEFHNTVGILIEEDARRNLIGGVHPSAANAIHGNMREGIRIVSGTNILIRANSIAENGAMGVDLGGDGATANDDGDADTGANALLNYPLLGFATNSGTNVVVTGSLRSQPARAFAIDFYSSVICDTPTNSQGHVFLGTTNVNTDNGGFAGFRFESVTQPYGKWITAACTDTFGNTSEHSPCFPLSNVFAPTTFVVTSTADIGPGSLRDTLRSVNMRSVAGDRIVFNIPGNGIQTIMLDGGLPPVSTSLTIDGATQPGFDGTMPLIQIIGADDINRKASRGFRIHATNCVVRALNMYGFSHAALYLIGGGGHTVQGCRFEIDAPAAIPSGSSVGAINCGNNLFGGTAPFEMNHFKGAVRFDGVAGKNTFFGNHFLDPYLVGASAPTALQFYGSQGNIIGGHQPGQANCFTGGMWPLVISGLTASNNIVLGNTFQDSKGSSISLSAPHNLIGGNHANEANVFVGAASFAILMDGTNANNNRIQGNIIGLLRDGITTNANGAGIHIRDAQDNLIGGADIGEGNLISGNLGPAILISGASATRNRIVGNRIGTDASGMLERSNVVRSLLFLDASSASIGITLGASSNIIGGSLPGEANIVAYGRFAGIEIDHAGSSNNIIRGNMIYSHGRCGIDLTINGSWRGLNANDVGDADAGGNDFQNFPVLAAASTNGGNIFVTGTINSRGYTPYVIDFYAGSNFISGVNPQIHAYLGQTTTSPTDSSGNAAFATTLSLPPAFGYITATATDPFGNTSELSPARFVLGSQPADLLAPLQLLRRGEGSSQGFDVLWPAESNPGLRLEHTTNLASPVTWSLASPWRTNSGSRIYSVTNSGAGEIFFRLRYDP